MRTLSLFLRRNSANYLALSALLGLSISVTPKASAQNEFSKDSGGSVALLSHGSDSASDSSSNSGIPDSSFASSSASSQDVAPVPAEPAPAPPPAVGQRDASYGYGSDRHHYFNHLAFEAGGGANAPIGNDAPFITWGGNFTVGGGLRLQKHISVLAEYQFMDNKLPGGLISDAGAQGGHAHIWSLTLDPVIDLFPNRRNDFYVTGGGGFYRKVTSFTDPEEVEECYYFCVVGTENVVVSHFSSNQGGANLGIGISHRLSADSNMKVFAEARYTWINTPAIGETDGLGTTGLIPVTLGVRF